MLGYLLTKLTTMMANEILNASYIVHRLFPVYYSTSRVAIEVNIGSTFKLIFPQNLYKLIDAFFAAKHLVTA